MNVLGMENGRRQFQTSELARMLTAGVDINGTLGDCCNLRSQSSDASNDPARGVSFADDTKTGPRTSAQKPFALASEGLTALYLATEKGNVDAVGMLLKAGAAVDKGGATDEVERPLLVAAKYGHTTIMTQLLEAGADYMQTTPSIQESQPQWTLLHLLRDETEYGNTNCLAILHDWILTHGSDDEQRAAGMMSDAKLG